MAHGDRRWIRDWRGRLKKSKDRTRKDWLAELNSPEVQDRIRSDRCPQCRQLEKRRPVQYYSRRYLVPAGVPKNPRADCWECRVDRSWIDAHGHVRRDPAPTHWHWDRVGVEDAWRFDACELRAVKLGYPAECRRCREKHETLRNRMPNGDRHRGEYAKAPAFHRRGLERARRAEYKDLLRRAKFDAELYDEIPTKYFNDAGWYWW